MRGFTQNKLVTVSTIKLSAISVGISIVITCLLTGLMSLLLLGKLSTDWLFANAAIGTIVPAVVAPFVINLLKQATDCEKTTRQLKAENIERMRLEKEAAQKARDMQAVNELSIECAAATPETDIIKLIAEKLRDIIDALGVAVTLYDPVTRTLTTKNIAVSGQILSAANQLVGFSLLGMMNPVTPEMETHMLSSVVDTFPDLSDVSFGLVPKPIATLIKNTLGVGDFVGLALCHGGELMGTAIIALRAGQPAMDPDVYKTLAHVSAVSIQRTNAERALRENEFKFRTLIENLSEGILLLDDHGTVIEWNASKEAITGIAREDAIGRRIWDIQFQLIPEEIRTPERYASLKNMSQQALQSREFSNFGRPFEGVIATADGLTRHILQTSFLIPMQTGHRIGSIMRDISTQKQNEADRELLISELKSKNTELEQFTYTVSHDLKAPIFTISGFLGLLEKDAVTGNIERLQKDIWRIREATEKMQRLLNELLELSRIGRMVNRSENVPLERIVEDAIASVQGRLNARAVTVTVQPGMPMVHVDQVRLNQVMQNLLDNAAKFMGEQNQPHIEIGADGWDKDGKAILYISDNGIGIEPHQLENVFGLFQKLDAGGDGTGIGLALVKRIIEVHGGRIWIASEGINRGTTIYFTLPVP